MELFLWVRSLVPAGRTDPRPGPCAMWRMPSVEPVILGCEQWIKHKNPPYRCCVPNRVAWSPGHCNLSCPATNSWMLSALPKSAALKTNVVYHPVVEAGVHDVVPGALVLCAALLAVGAVPPRQGFSFSPLRRSCPHPMSSVWTRSTIRLRSRFHRLLPSHDRLVVQILREQNGRLISAGNPA